MSLIDQLDDHCFVLATEHIAALCAAIESEAGEKPTLDELCELLTWGIRSCSADLFSDTDPSNVLQLIAKVRKRGKTRPQVGDVIAIPAEAGGYWLTCYLGLIGHYGHGFGLVRGRHPLRAIPADWQPQIVPPVIFAALDGLSVGQWKVVGHSSTLRARFPEHPEAYQLTNLPHYARIPGDVIGAVAIAESADSYAGRRHEDDIVDLSPYFGGTCFVRRLSAAEAAEIGLLDGSYISG
ncbi:MAG: hypothetical protein SFV23_06980, partial [Planctomycetaceae bacterium]|nr:hypothetical protein [Planctomycetaceae bacterium]